MKYIRNILLSLVGVYILSLVFISIDINDNRPFVSLFKKLQTDSALEVVDFSVEKKDYLNFRYGSLWKNNRLDWRPSDGKYLRFRKRTFKTLKLIRVLIKKII